MKRLVRLLEFSSGSLTSLPLNLGTKEPRTGTYRLPEAHDASDVISEKVRFQLGNKDPSQFQILHCKRRNRGAQLPCRGDRGRKGH